MYYTKVIQGRRIDTGPRALIFKQVRHHIPSYVFVMGWPAYVKYAGQPQICRICGLTGHFAKGYPKSQKEAGAKKAQPESPESKSKGKSYESKDTPMETQSFTSQVTQAEIMDTPCTKEPVQEHLEALHVIEPDPEVLHSRLDDVIGSVSTDEDIHSVDSLDEDQDDSPAREFPLYPSRIWLRLHKPGLTPKTKPRERLDLSLAVRSAELILALKVSVLLPEFGKRVRGKVLLERTASQVVLL